MSPNSRHKILYTLIYRYFTFRWYHRSAR